MGREVQEAIADAVRAIGVEALDGLIGLVRIPSVTGEEAAAQRWMSEAMAELGLEVDTWCPALAELQSHPAFTNVANRDTAGRPNVVGRWKGAGGGRSLILDGHVDVVDPGARESWRRDPWGGAVVEGRLYGRGACDMKAGLLAALYAVKAVRRAGLRLRGDLVLESVIGEEEGGAGTLAALLRGYRADAAVIMEPSRLAVVPAAAGLTVFRLTVEGRSAHASQRERGVSALEKFIPLFHALHRLEAEINEAVDHPLFRHQALPAPLNINWIEAGGPYSTVPDRLVAHGRYGFLGSTTAEARQRFEAHLARAAAADPWLAKHPPRLEWTTPSNVWDPVEAPRSLVDAMVTSFRGAAGREPVVEGVSYGSDMRILTNAGGIPTVIFGPGDVAQAHFPDEYVSIAEYLTAIKVLAAFIADWCSTA